MKKYDFCPIKKRYLYPKEKRKLYLKILQEWNVTKKEVGE